MAQLTQEGQEAKEITRVLSMYGPIPMGQLLRLFPDNVSKVENLVWRLQKLFRVYISPNGEVSLGEEERPDLDRQTALWVLIDFIDRAVFHSVSDFPVQLTFFAEGQPYEVVVVHLNQEALMNHAFWCQRGGDPPRRIVVLDEKRQAQFLSIENTVGYCTVAEDGTVNYFNLEVNDV